MDSPSTALESEYARQLLRHLQRHRDVPGGWETAERVSRRHCGGGHRRPRDDVTGAGERRQQWPVPVTPGYDEATGTGTSRMAQPIHRLLLRQVTGPPGRATCRSTKIEIFSPNGPCRLHDGHLTTSAAETDGPPSFEALRAASAPSPRTCSQMLAGDPTGATAAGCRLAAATSRRGPPASARARSVSRCRCGTTVYLGSRAEAIPAWKTPQRVAADAPSRAAPETAAATRRGVPAGRSEFPTGSLPRTRRRPGSGRPRRYAPPRPVW